MSHPELQALRCQLFMEACEGAASQLDWARHFAAGGHTDHAGAGFRRAMTFIRSASAVLRDIEADEKTAPVGPVSEAAE